MTRSEIVQKYGKRFFFIAIFLFIFEKEKKIIQKWTKKKLPLKKQTNHLNHWRITQLLMCGFWMYIFHYCFFFNYAKKSETPYYTIHMSHITCHMSHVTCHMSRITCPVSHVMCHVSHGMCLISHFTCNMSLVTCDIWHFTSHMSPGT